MYLRFAFEGDVHRTLEMIPLSVRRKLDLSGLKLSLAAWTALSRAERLAVCHLPVDSPEELEVYREALRGFAERAGHPAAPLESGPADPRAWGKERIPEALSARLPEAGARIDPLAWGALPEDARYSLVKLAEPRRTPEKLALALRELGIG